MVGICGVCRWRRVEMNERKGPQVRIPLRFVRPLHWSARALPVPPTHFLVIPFRYQKCLEESISDVSISLLRFLDRSGARTASMPRIARGRC